MDRMERQALYRAFVTEFHIGEPPVPATPAQLDEAEDLLETLFPASYRLFMESHGELYTPAIFDLIDELPGMPDLKNLASIQQVLSDASMLRSGGTPDDLIAIGNDAMGNLFCLPRLGKVVERPDDLPIQFFDHEFLDVAVVAPSFDEWLSGYLNIKNKKESRTS